MKRPQNLRQVEAAACGIMDLVEGIASSGLY